MDKLTVGQAAQALNVTKQAIHNRIRRNAIQAEKIDGAWYILREEVERLKSANHEPETEDKRVCNQCEMLQTRLETSERMNEVLLKRIEWLESQMERTTILLAAEQQQRVKALPSPFSWVKRFIGRGQSLQ